MSFGLVILSFFCGAIPFGYLAGRARGIDIRTVGSGNIGTSNVFRTLGKAWGVGVFLLDFLKGFLPTLAALHLVGGGFLPKDVLVLLVGMAAVLGHNFTPFLQFKGGKGIATSAGVLLAMMPSAASVAILVFAIVFVIWRYVSLASLTAAVYCRSAPAFSIQSDPGSSSLLH